MTGPRRAVSWLFAAILVAYMALALWYSVTIPLGEAPDEVPHFTVVRYLVQEGHLPTGTDEHEAWQPPLYYALGAGLTFWIEDDPQAPFAVRANAHYDPVDPRAPKTLLLHSAAEAWPYEGWALAWRLGRLLSIAFGAVTVWAVFRLGALIFPRQPAVPLAMAALTAFTPQFLFVSAVLNNDNAATALSALTLWQVAVVLYDEDGGRLWRHAAVLGLLLGLAVLSKASLIALLPIVGLAILVASARCALPARGTLQIDASEGDERQGKRASRGSRSRLAGVALVVAFGLAALVAGWYFFRNWLIFGDPLGWAFLRQTHALREGALTLGVVGWLFKGIFRSFWLGWIGISLDGFLYWLVGGACLAGAAGFVVWLVRRWRGLRGSTRWTLALLGLHAVVTLASLVQWTATVQGTDQGRLIYPILPTVMLVIAGGWAWWARGRAEGWVLGGLSAGMLCLALITPPRYLAPVYAPAPVATADQLAAAKPLDVTWANVRLLGYRLESSQVQPGGELVLELYWDALLPVEGNFLALIQLVDAEDRFLMYVDGSPSAGRDTTDRWPPGVTLASRHLLPIPDYGQPGDYRLTISLHPSDEETWLPGSSPDGPLPGDRLVLPETVHIVAR